jgi:hypothetical protein
LIAPEKHPLRSFLGTSFEKLNHGTLKILDETAGED